MRSKASMESKDPVDTGVARNAERYSHHPANVPGRTPEVAIAGTGVPGVPSASLGAGSSTALTALRDGNSAQDDR